MPNSNPVLVPTCCKPELPQSLTKRVFTSKQAIIRRRKETSIKRLISGVALLTIAAATTQAVVGTARPVAETFEVAKVHFEQNATDEDVEVVFEVKGDDEGLSKLTVVSPDGRTAIDFSAPNPSTLGILQFRFESPEPGDAESLKAAYPEGVYTFFGATATGHKLQSRATLSHKLPATAAFLRPGEDAKGVRTDHLKITWTPVRDVTTYIIEIEQEEEDVAITARLPASVTAFAIPDRFLRPGMEYKVGIGTETEEGNLSFVETTFTTAVKE